MIKYIVMGIKLFVEKKTCPECNNGVLLPYAWKTCELHSYKGYSKVTPLIFSEIKSELYGSLTFHCNREKALQSDTLIYDEDMNIIGYKTPLFRLKV